MCLLIVNKPQHSKQFPSVQKNEKLSSSKTNRKSLNSINFKKEDINHKKSNSVILNSGPTTVKGFKLYTKQTTLL